MVCRKALPLLLACSALHAQVSTDIASILPGEWSYAPISNGDHPKELYWKFNPDSTFALLEQGMYWSQSGFNGDWTPNGLKKEIRGDDDRYRGIQPHVIRLQYSEPAQGLAGCVEFRTGSLSFGKYLVFLEYYLLKGEGGNALQGNFTSLVPADSTCTVTGRELQSIRIDSAQKKFSFKYLGRDSVYAFDYAIVTAGARRLLAIGLDNSDYKTFEYALSGDTLKLALVPKPDFTLTRVPVSARGRRADRRDPGFQPEPGWRFDLNGRRFRPASWHFR